MLIKKSRKLINYFKIKKKRRRKKMLAKRKKYDNLIKIGILLTLRSVRKNKKR